MIEFFNRLFGRQNSGATAKERLRLVLMSDHLSLAPEMIDSMKRDLVDVISKYVQVDREKIDVHFENQDNALAMLANIPITGVNRNGGDGGSKGDDDHGTSNGSSKRKRRKSGQNGQAPQNGAPAPAT
jgi:cell division topological specificity factor